MILAGDVAAPRSISRYTTSKAASSRSSASKSFPASEFATLQDVVHASSARATLAQRWSTRSSRLVSAAPARSRDGHLKLTNLPWELDARDLSKILDIEHIFLINDLEANGYGIAELGPDQIFELEVGDKSAIGHRALVSAGTGLGEAILVWKQHCAPAHATAFRGWPRGLCRTQPAGIDMLEWLMKKLNACLVERWSAGLGLKTSMNSSATARR